MGQGNINFERDARIKVINDKRRNWLEEAEMNGELEYEGESASTGSSQEAEDDAYWEEMFGEGDGDTEDND